jgi:hypothetical protein
LDGTTPSFLKLGFLVEGDMEKSFMLLMPWISSITL